MNKLDEYEWSAKLRPLGDENFRPHDPMDVPLFLQTHGYENDSEDYGRVAKWVKGYNRAPVENKKGWRMDAEPRVKSAVALEFQHLGDYRAIGKTPAREKLMAEIQGNGWYDPRLESIPDWRLEKWKNDPNKLAEGIVNSGFDAVLRGFDKKPFKYSVDHDQYHGNEIIVYDSEDEVNPAVRFPPRKMNNRETYMEDSMKSDWIDFHGLEEPVSYDKKSTGAYFRDEDEKIKFAIDKVFDDLIELGVHQVGVKERAVHTESMMMETEDKRVYDRYVNGQPELYTLW